jgi:hypothetical protein
VKPLGRLFRGMFLAALVDLHARGRLTLAGALQDLAGPRRFAAWVGELRGTDWVVYAKPPLGGPEQVLKYLARYAHRVAISNHRLVGMDDRSVSFRWKDYAADNAPRTMTLEGVEFLRRFLQHVLAGGFVRIRHFGFLANRCRDDKLARRRELLGQAPPPPVPAPLDEEALESCVAGAGGEGEPDTAIESPPCCPACGVGRMRIVGAVPRQAPRQPVCEPAATDTS